MFFYQDLLNRINKGKPIRVCLIGAGKFGSMFLSQVPTSLALTVTSIVDLYPEKAKELCKTIGWSVEQIKETNFFDNSDEAFSRRTIDVVVEATGDPIAGAFNAQKAIKNGLHVVMVNVEADVLVGAELAKQAVKNGVVYSMAYGDQPALTCELVEWARASGFKVITAGKGTKYLAEYHKSTPTTVWDHYGLTSEEASKAGMRSKMFNSFLDGTKSAIEMAALSNATGLSAPTQGLKFPPCSVDDLANTLKPVEDGGIMEEKGQVEVVSSLERNGTPVLRDLRWGVYIIIEAPNEYSASCFKQYGMNTDTSGKYVAMYKPFHLIGLELNISIFAAAILHKATGTPIDFCSDVVAIAKKDLKRGQLLDGEGGHTVWGKLYPAETSIAIDALPIGLANYVKLRKNVVANMPIRWQDVEIDKNSPIVLLRRKMEEKIKSDPRFNI